MRRTNRGHRALAAGSLVMVCALVLGACSSTSHKKKVVPKATTTTTAPQALCPLTGTPAPGGAVPQRTAIAVKIDNYVAARPQSGLDHTDMVFEEPVEGGITRYVAIFQCQNAASIGPVRSARNIDVGILGQLGNPPLVHVGGIAPVLSNIAAAGIDNLDLGNNAQSAATHPSGRNAPYDTYTSTSALYALVPQMTTPPTPLFTFSTATPPSTAVTSVHIPFSSNSDVTWVWSATKKTWLRYYNGTQADVGADGVQNSAANVVVQSVQISYGPWLENSEGGLEVQAQLSGTSGPAMVFRNGIEVSGTWSRPSSAAPTVFTSTTGQTITMAPGRTWIELVPSTVAVTAQPAPPTPTTTTTTQKKSKKG